MNDILMKIFSQQQCLSEETMQKYLDGKLSAAEKHAVERHLADCEMCSDEIEGLSLISDRQGMEKIISGITGEIKERTIERKSRVIFTDFRIRIAVAAFIILAIGTTFLLTMNKSLTPTQISENLNKETKTSSAAEETAMTIPSSDAQAGSKAKWQDSTSSLVAGNVRQQNSPEKSADAKAIYPIEIMDKNTNPNSSTFMRKDGSGISSGTGIALKEITNETDKIITENAENMDVARQDEIAENEIEKIHTEEQPAGEQEKRLLQKPVAEVTRSKKAEAGKSDISMDIEPQQGRSAGKNKKSEYAPKQEQISSVPADDYAPFIPASDTVSADRENKNTVLNDALVLYNMKQYTDAAILFDEYIQKDTRNMDILYFAAISHYKSSSFTRSIELLDVILNDEKNQYFEDAQWAKALTFVKTRKTEPARKILNDIISRKGRYSKQAEEILNKL